LHRFDIDQLNDIDRRGREGLRQIVADSNLSSARRAILGFMGVKLTARRFFLSAGLAAVAALSAALAQTGPGNAAQEPRFTADGQLVAPRDYRDWVFLSSGLGMTYGPISGAGATPENPRFENVFVNRPAYESFLKTGMWPEHTIFVLEVRSSVTK
jgi:hypothetical protein